MIELLIPALIAIAVTLVVISTRQIVTEMPEGFPGFPFAGDRVLVPFGKPARGGDQQTKSHVRRGIGEHPRGVADGDAALRGRRHVDVVEADRVVADYLQARGGVHERGVDLICQQ